MFELSLASLTCLGRRIPLPSAPADVRVAARHGTVRASDASEPPERSGAQGPRERGREGGSAGTQSPRKITMSKISIGKVVPGGILAGVVMSGLDYATNNFVLAADWRNVAQMRNIDLSVMGGTSALVTMAVVDFLLGQLLVVTYAAIRPRFGPGAGTAAIASFIIFLPAALILATFGGIFISWDLYIRQSALMLVSVIAGGLAGAWVYSEDDSAEDS